MKCNLRREPEGKLTDKLIGEISKKFVHTIRERNIKFDLVVGLPRAGEPFAERFVEIWNKKYPDKKKIIYLKKGEIGGKRSILEKIRGEFNAGDTVLMIDDVISLAHSKIEAAKALRKNGLIVKHCIVLMDWELGGSEMLKTRHQLKIVSEYLVSEFLHIWKEACLISRSRAEEVLFRKDEIKIHIEKHNKAG
jgi:orotate phosphoribosyltransferase